MKRIVKGLLYDTEKAEVVSRQKLPEGWATLYRTKKGHYFLHTEYTTLKTIEPMTANEAFEWLAEHDPDKAIELFPEKHIEEA